MDAVYISCVCESGYFYELFGNCRIMPGQQVQKYHRLIIEGLAGNGIKVKVISSPPITRANSRRIFHKRKQVTDGRILYNHLPVINLPIIKNVFALIATFFVCMFTLKRGMPVICDVLNKSVAMGARAAAKLKGVYSVGIVTDIPVMLSQGKESFSVRLNTKLMNSFDSYVVLTEQMKELINCEGKKCVVIEGQVDANMKSNDNLIENKYEKKICIYAGGLDRIYGIDYLTEAFIKADEKDAELHIYGNGDYEEELKKISAEHSNVKFFGVKPNSYVVEEQLKATLLINPRPSNEEYTKYSFPSKNMEYMVSGTPILTTKLPGMPEEYYPYVYLIQEETADGLADELKKILSKETEQLHCKGEEAKKWVLENKNNIIQAKKILEMIQS